MQNGLLLEQFKRRFEPPERPTLLPTPVNSHTPDPMRSVAFVASSERASERGFF